MLTLVHASLIDYGGHDDSLGQEGWWQRAIGVIRGAVYCVSGKIALGAYLVSELIIEE